MEKEIKIESLKINIGKKEIELSIEDAEKLKRALEDIFGGEIVHEHHYHWYYRQYPHYPTPWGQVYCTAGATANNQIPGNTINSNQLCINVF